MERTIPRRIVLGAGAALAGTGLMGLRPPVGAQAAEGDLGLAVSHSDLGIAASERNVRTGTATTTHKGIPLLCLLSDGNPVSFNVINADTGALVGSFPLPPKSIGSYPTVGTDGNVYFVVRDGKSSLVHRYDVARNKVTFLVESPSGDSVTRTIRVEGSTIYGSTYPNAKAFSYDIDTGTVRDYGRVVASTDTYGWGFEKIGNHLYVGTGIGEGHLVRVDIETGEKTEITIPEPYDSTLTYFYWFRRVGHLLAMAFSPGIPNGTNALFYDTRTEKFVLDGAIPGFLSLNGPLTQPTPDGKLYFKSSNEIHELDTTDGTTRATGWAGTGLAATGSHRTLDLTMVGRGRLARPVLLGGNNDGSFWRFDPITGEHSFFPTVVDGAPLTAHAIAAGPDAKIYVSTYLGPGAIARFDPATSSTEVLTGPGQADTMLAVGDDLLLGSYPGGVVHRGNPSQPWKYGTNPSQQYRLIGDAQDRIIAMAAEPGTGTERRIAIGTVSDYGVTGGALTIQDTDNTVHVYRDLIDRQSVTSVLWGTDGLVYAGTSIRGGLSSPTSSGDAELLVVDPADGTLVHHGVPVAGNDVVAGLAPGRDGRLWGVTNTGHLFAFDTTQRKFVADLDLGVGGSPSPWGLASTLTSHPSDGLLYGLVANRLFAFDPVSQVWQFLSAPGLKRLTVAPDGMLYAVDETHLHSYTVQRG